MHKKSYCIENFATELRRRVEESEGNAQESFQALSQQLKVDVSSLCAEQMAREMDMWFEFSTLPALGTPMPSGVENDVYLSGEGNYIYKINNLMTSKTILGLFERLCIHNSIFPQTNYTLYGFTGFGKGSIYPILRQDFICYEREATPVEIDTYMSALGFEKVNISTFSNGKVIVSDLHPRNVLRDEEGDLFVIDADFTNISPHLSQNI